MIQQAVNFAAAVILATGHFALGLPTTVSGTAGKGARDSADAAIASTTISVDSVAGQSPQTTSNRDSLVVSPSSELSIEFPCATGAAHIRNREFKLAQPLLWLCVLSDGRQPQDAVNLTLTYRDLRNYAEGQSKVTSEIERTPSNEDLHYIAAYLLFRTEQHTLSIKELTTAYLMKHDDWRLHQLFAMNFVVEQKSSYAEQEYIRAINLNPNDAELYYQLSRLLYTEQRFGEALAASSRAISISPNYAEAYDNLGLCYEANGDIPRAIESFSRAINLTEHAGNRDAWPYINFAVLLAIQSPGAAIPLLKQAIVIDPNNTDANYYLGRSFRETGQEMDAQQYFEKTIEIDSNCEAAYYALATLLRTHDPEKSKVLMGRFEELRNEKPTEDHSGLSRACTE